jgi:hypothetical protein
MIFGFNTDVAGKDGAYHVQTEDRGPKHPVIDSIIYMGGGKIVDRRRTEYDPSQVTPKQIEEMVRRQHKELVEAIRSGTYVRPASLDEKPTSTNTGNNHSSYVIELLNADDLSLDGQLCFDLAVRENGKTEAPQNVTLEARWLTRDVAPEPRTVELGTDGRAGIVVPIPPTEADGILVVRAKGPGGEAFSKFRASSGRP